MLNRETRAIVAFVQALIGAEWLISGFNKLLSGTFPQGLAGTLNDGLSGNPNAWYASFLQQVVLPHSVAFGYLIEFVEPILGILLVTGALTLLLRPRMPGDRQHRLAVFQIALAAGAALVGAFLCVNFHFWMGDGIVPTLNRAHPFNEGIDLDTLLPPLSLLVTYINIRLLGELTGAPISTRIRGLLNATKGHTATAATATTATSSSDL